MAGYQVKLPVFEGPFDLLYHLIEEQKVNIYEIPIALITAQYLDYLHMMEILDMEVASSFLVMAATLLEIKSKMLLPKTPAVDEGMLGDEDREDGSLSADDARNELVNKLLEYKKFKMAALALREMEKASSRIFSRSYQYVPQPEEILQVHVGSNDLLNLYQGLVRRRLNPPMHKVVLDRISLNEKITQIRRILRERSGKIPFQALFPEAENKLERVLSFMAILEMCKAGEVDIMQSDNFSPIFLKMSKEKDAAKTPPKSADAGIPNLDESGT